MTHKNHPQEPFQQLAAAISQVSDACTDCPQCRVECAFLEQYGTPKTIARTKDITDPAFLRMAYECSLCGLCGAVCPVGLHPEEMFLAMRRAAVWSGSAPLEKYKRLLAFEKRSMSRRYTHYSLPENCDTVFFPGCALPGTRPEKTLALYNHLKTLVPGIGMVLDCCGKISYDLGRADHFMDMFSEMKSFFDENGVTQLITACPNCHVLFKEYGTPLSVQSVFEVLAEKGLPPDSAPRHPPVALHDACVTRHDASIQDAVRTIAIAKGLAFSEMDHNRKKTLCCGEGGSVRNVNTGLSGAWKTRRIRETAGKPIMAYCAGCTQALQGNAPVFHIVDLLFDPACIAAGTPRASRWPMTYLNRLWLKHVLKKQENPALTRERTYIP
ncbi:MAG: (Fe-S)-binding protein [Thermodesulfobacteriota bacterium]